jgi:hypothetical protein
MVTINRTGLISDVLTYTDSGNFQQTENVSPIDNRTYFSITESRFVIIGAVDEALPYADRRIQFYVARSCGVVLIGPLIFGCDKLWNASRQFNYTNYRPAFLDVYLTGRQCAACGFPHAEVTVHLFYILCVSVSKRCPYLSYLLSLFLPCNSFVLSLPPPPPPPNRRARPSAATHTNYSPLWDPRQTIASQ